MGSILKTLDRMKKDPFMEKILVDFMRNVRLNALITKIKPYTTVSLSFLAEEIKCDEVEIKTLLIELILEGKVNGKIDQESGFFEIVQTEREIE